ncbi:MAG: NAD(+)/NADH kinase [Phycisphaerales bacterium]|nr:MAG: NAD(+)/NADH kinase [Phycisphaerales bacterium]
MKPEDGCIRYIVNPKSGARNGTSVGRQFEQYLLKKGFEVTRDLTASLENARELAAAAAGDSDCAMVVGVGGDGTIREIAQGLAGSSKPLMIVPRGTENLLATELGFDARLKTLIRTFERECIRPLDLGSANGKCFTSIAGFGFDAHVVERVSANRTGHISYLTYVGPIWRAFWDYEFGPMRVQVDGEEIFDGPCLVFVGNISRYAMGLRILHSADFGDGLLDVCIFKCMDRLQLVKLSAMTALKQHGNGADFIYRQGKEIVVSSATTGIKTEIDGDPGPPLPVHIKVIPHAVNVIVPRRSHEQKS